MAQQFDYEVICDGGCRNHGTDQAHGYGSYQIRTNNGGEAIVRLDFGPSVTNNIAEYRALIGALEDVASRIEKAGRQLEEFSIAVKSDSQLVVNQVNGNWKIKRVHLRPFADKAKALLAKFQHTRLTWVSRDNVEAVLGH